MTLTQPQITIDVHAHVVVPDVNAKVAARPEWPFIDEAIKTALGERSYAYNNTQAEETILKSTDVGLRLADMDRMGVDIQVLSPSPMQFHYWADPDLASALVTEQNDYIANICAAYPDRFIGLGAVALQHPRLAVSHLRECMATYKFSGIEICTTYPGADLSSPNFEPFWQQAEQLNAVIMMHPLGSSLGERTVPYYLSNIIGQPLDTTIALSHMIFSGVFDRYPGLKVCAVHGGGYLPSYIGRFDHAFRVRPESQGMRHPPSVYLHQIYLDTVVFSPDNLSHLIKTAGIKQIVFGTDYPFDMGDYDINALLDGVSGLDDAGRYAIRSGNAKRLILMNNG